MNLEELMILFIPQVAFLQGVKLSKVALPYSSTNKKNKRTTTREWRWRMDQVLVCVERGVWPPIYVAE